MHAKIWDFYNLNQTRIKPKIKIETQNKDSTIARMANFCKKAKNEKLTKKSFPSLKIEPRPHCPSATLYGK